MNLQDDTIGEIDESILHLSNSDLALHSFVTEIWSYLNDINSGLTQILGYDKRRQSKYLIHFLIQLVWIKLDCDNNRSCFDYIVHSLIITYF